MVEKLNKTMLFFVFSLILIGENIAFGLHDYAYEGDWDYHGSGRDHPYSAYIDRSHDIDIADYTLSAPIYIDQSPYIRQVPVVIIPPPPNAFTVTFPDGHGGFTAVIIKKSGEGFVGPKGEYYPEFPKVFQLRLKYGS